MSVITDKISSSEYIYSACTKWGVKKYICDVAYFTEEPLDDLYYVICSILDSTEEKCYDKHSLGILLGFCMSDQELDGKREVYYDVAEVRIFEDILSRVEKEHLVKIVGNEVILTELGRISLKEGKHYQFFIGTQDVYEHSMVKSRTPMAMIMFPFYKDMGIYSSIKTKKNIWPEDEEIEKVIYYNNDQLKKRIELQSKERSNIYFAELQAYFDLETINVSVELFKAGNEYIPAIMNGDCIAVCATELLNEELNKIRKENIVLECLFLKLWDDKSSILSYESLEPYFDLVDYEELTKDSRTIWTDSKLFEVIVDRATATCWRNITRHCNIEVLKEHIKDYKDFLDWPILTERIDDSFLIDSFLIYPWNLEVLSEDVNRKESVIEQLILFQKETEEDWNWEELENRLSRNFVLAHLDLVKVNLASYTNDSEEVRKAILRYSDKRWDWNKVENEFCLDFIYENISILGVHFELVKLLDRVFTNTEWASKFVCNDSFADIIAQASKGDGVLSSAIFNDKEYLWTSDIIDLLYKNGLLCWQSTLYMKGFECNPYLVWTKEFFDKYSVNEFTEEGRKYVSSRISDINILIDSKSYQWDWDSISSNKSLLSEKLLFSCFGSKLNWKVVLANQTDATFLQTINGIELMIGEDKDAWTAFSSIASIDYVISKYKDFKYPWDWTVLTERMFPRLKLENLGNRLFVEQWDWTYISGHVGIDFLMDNLEKFSKYWNWEVSLPRILTPAKRFDYNFLDKLAVILTDIPGRERCQAAWSAMTKQYSFRELKKIIRETIRKREYWWDMDYFCRHKEFYVFRDLDECRNIVDWNILSSSETVDESFKYNPKLGIKEKAWRDEIRKILSDERNRWNYALLSHFESLRDERWFLSQHKDKIDWNYISKFSRVFCVRDEQQLNEIIEEYKRYVNFKSLSERNDVDIEQIIKINPRAEYDYNKLIEHGIVKPTMQFVEKMPDYPWDWQLLTSSTSTFYPTVQFLLSHIDCEINWKLLSLQNNQAWSNEELIIAVAKNDSISKQIDWYSISSLKEFPITNKVLSVVPIEDINWKYISSRKSIVPFIDDYIDYIDWRVLSNNQYVKSTTLEFLNKYKDYVDWSIICKKSDFKFTKEILDSFADYIDWSLASDSKDIYFSRELVDKYRGKWNWPVLVNNKAFSNTFETSDMLCSKQINVVEFVSKFPRRPKAYHFTHMDNAIKIIRAMKLQSRNCVEGNFSNSAGSNVYRTGKAHRFARFYFRPKTPTQFYNECLGKDIDDNKYYSRALNLGLPKCPLPVFFIFDIEELLSVMPDLCYYSNGNMQKDSSRYFKVVDDPNRIKAREIYINSSDTFDERQQEFLIDGELDFSKLKDVKICCYDDFQAEMLRKEVKGTKWAYIVSCCPELYLHTNKVLYFRENNETITVNTDYRSPFELRVAYSGNQTPTIVNKENVIRQRGNNIYVSSSVEIKKDCSFEVYFEVSSPRTGSWLVYRNK
ncbi:MULTISPECIES: DarT ssDNA thymidine ADP-ribosyltransferase family protein [unclassified Bacteroides]|uniref:DarT ssDNA thymidine ADP-ribosyltransferase family protein n=1 Tax=unclassified Bacteroides TaxID=2646097 RepID=UPI0004E12BCB|nr:MULTISPECIES: DarT ssDNA thymidine ADP-ribosyltransferase family protein [unclassified Bacteroides]